MFKPSRRSSSTRFLRTMPPFVGRDPKSGSTAPRSENAECFRNARHRRLDSLCLRAAKTEGHEETVKKAQEDQARHPRHPHPPTHTHLREPLSPPSTYPSPRTFEHGHARHEYLACDSMQKATERSGGRRRYRPISAPCNSEASSLVGTSLCWLCLEADSAQVTKLHKNKLRWQNNVCSTRMCRHRCGVWGGVPQHVCVYGCRLRKYAAEQT